MESDRRLVEDVEHADELRADLRREPQPLRLAARECRGRAVELQVTDADVVQEREPLADLLDDSPADQLLGLSELELVQELQRARDRHLRELVDVEATFRGLTPSRPSKTASFAGAFLVHSRSLAADRDREHLRLQARPLAGRTRTERHVLLDAFALRRRVRLAVPALE
jgi:hypothetical protein